MIYLAAICALELVVLALVIKVVLDDRGRAETAWQTERADLLQRIQAPQAAITQHWNEGEQPVNPPAVIPDDDEDYWEAKELMAERLAAEEVNR